MGNVHDLPVVVPADGLVMVVGEEGEAPALVHEAAPVVAALQLGIVVGEVEIIVRRIGKDHGNSLIGKLIRENVAAVGHGPEVGEEEVLPQPVEGGGAQVLRHFLPAGDLYALGLGDVQHAGNEVVLEFVDVLHPLFLHQGLAGGGTLPRALRHLVAAHMDRLQRHPGLLVQGDDSVKDLVQE